MISSFKYIQQKFLSFFWGSQSLTKPPQQLYFQNRKISSYHNLNPEIIKQYRQVSEIHHTQYQSPPAKKIYHDNENGEREKIYLTVKYNKTNLEYEKEFSGGLKELLNIKNQESQVQNQEKQLMKVHVMEIRHLIFNNNEEHDYKQDISYNNNNSVVSQEYTHSRYLEYSEKPSFITSSENEQLDHEESWEKSEYMAEGNISDSLEEMGSNLQYWREKNIRPCF